MSRQVFAVVLTLGFACASTEALACHWFGTQLECALGRSELVLGTQTETEPTDARSVRPLPFQGGGRTADRHTVHAPPLRIELQNVGADPSLCRRFGDETYCY